MNLRTKFRDMRITAMQYASICCILAAAGCNTVTPAETKARQPSFDGGIQNSGFEGWTTNVATGEVFGVISNHARARYNALLAAYGKRFATPLALDSGLTLQSASGAGAWKIDLGALIDFETMNRWRKEGQKP